MKFCCKRYSLLMMMMLGMVFMLCGCGGGGSGGDSAGAFRITGKINFANGSPGDNTTVRLYKTSYTIYPLAGGLFGTRNSSGTESVNLDSVTQETMTNSTGNYTFSGLYSGSYTILPSRSGYIFKSVSIPTLDRIGVLTITDGGTAYFYNPEGTGNQITPDMKIIYNSAPVTIVDHLLPNQDFEISLPGGA